MAIIHQDKVTLSFLDKAKEISNKLNIDVNWLMAVIHFESAGTFSPSITNSLGYTGLIQFGNDAAERIGTTTFNLRNMTAEQQLEYVYKYYLPYKSKLNSYVDLYLATFFPAAVGKSSSYILQTSRLTAERIANANPIFDYNKDKIITVGEIEKRMLSRIPEDWIDVIKKKE